MKKVYINPAISQYAIEPMTMIAESITGTSGATDLGAGGSSSSAGVTSGNSKERDNQESDAWNQGGLW